LLKETDCAPGGTNGTGDEGRVAEDGGSEAIKCCDGGAVEFLVGGDGEDDEDGGEETG
jgi:hypothetical protein